jgi:hypothetical protein
MGDVPATADVAIWDNDHNYPVTVVDNGDGTYSLKVQASVVNGTDISHIYGWDGTNWKEIGAIPQIGTKYNLQVAIFGTDGTSQYQIAVDSLGRIILSPPAPPAGKTTLRKYISQQLGAAGTYNFDYVIPNGQTWHLDYFGGGTEGSAQIVLIWDPDGENREIHRIYVEANNWEATVSEDLIGNGIKKLRLQIITKVAYKYATAYVVGYY